MDKTLITAAIVFVFATALVVIASAAIQSAQACPNTRTVLLHQMQIKPLQTS